MVISPNDELAARASESDRGYYCWRVVLAASLGVMVGFGSLFFAQTLISRAGWRAAYLGLGGLALLVGLPLTWRYVHERAPEHHPRNSAAPLGMT